MVDLHLSNVGEFKVRKIDWHTEVKHKPNEGLAGKQEGPFVMAPVGATDSLHEVVALSWLWLGR
jgi:hypothetical protein